MPRLPAHKVTPDCVVATPVVDMLASPTMDAELVSQAIIGSNLATQDRRGGWARVITDDGYPGWVRRDGLRELRNRPPYAATGPVVRIDSLFANVYAEPSARTHKPIFTVPYDAQLEQSFEVGTRYDEWISLRLPDGRTGWLNPGDGHRSLAPLSVRQSVALAKRFLGLPYLWGGRSTFGFDCSGFTQMLVRRRGIIMPRDADLQANWEGAVEVQHEDLRAGDLVFFGPSRAMINHTALYIGEGRIIHSTTAGRPGVQIGQLEDPKSGRKLMACRRIHVVPGGRDSAE